MLNRLLQLALAVVLTCFVMAGLARAQMPAHLDTALDLVDQITAAQSLGTIHKPDTFPLVRCNRCGGSGGSTTREIVFARHEKQPAN